MRVARSPAASATPTGAAEVPLVLSADVDIGIGVPEHDRHGLRTGRTHVDEIGVELLRQPPPPPAACASGSPPGGAARRVPDRAGSRAGERGHHHVPRRQCNSGCNRHAILDECDVHCPIGASLLAELASAVERIDDPDPLARRDVALPSRPSSERTASSGRCSASSCMSSTCAVRSPSSRSRFGSLKTDLFAKCHQCPTRGNGREAGELVVRTRPRARSPPRSLHSYRAQL